MQQSRIQIVMDYCHFGSLDKYLIVMQNCNKLRENEKGDSQHCYFTHLLRWSQQIATGMEFLASNGVRKRLQNRSVLMFIC